MLENLASLTVNLATWCMCAERSAKQHDNIVRPLVSTIRLNLVRQ